MAINKLMIRIEIIPRDSRSNPETTLTVSKELYEQVIKIIIGPVFNKNLIYLGELNEVTFLSLSNTNINNPKNVISGINAISQINAIKKFQEFAKLERSILLVLNSEFQNEIEVAIKETKLLKDKFIYSIDSTALTSQIEKLTRYAQRKQNLKDEIKRLENLTM